MAILLTCSACGGGDSSGTSGSVPSALDPFASGHRCQAPAPSGSEAQKACFAAAQAACPEGLSPRQVDFEEAPDGTFLIRGYRCS